jgi:threonine dehydratase
MAYAARRRGAALTVFASVGANARKIERIRRLGATVVLEGVDFDDAKLRARDYASDIGALFIEDGADPAISEGAGSIAVELISASAPIDVLLVPVGNGALINGIARWMKAHSPNIEVIGVCAEGAPAMARSWLEDDLICFDGLNTIAEGIGVRIPIPAALNDMRGLIDDMILVSDKAMVLGIKLCHRHCGLVVEPAGAAGLAAVIDYPARFAGQRVGTVLCGGNLTDQQAEAWLC